MPRFIITWDAGYGESAEEIDAPSMEAAEMEAYEGWKEEAEGSAVYTAEEYTEERAEFLGIEG